MSTPVQIHVRGLRPSQAVSERIQSHVDHLTRRFRRQQVLSCHVGVELENHRAGKAGCYRITIELAVPGRTLVVGRERGRPAIHRDVYAALGDAFDALENRIKHYVEPLRLEVKRHEPALASGEVARIFAYDGYGFIAGDDGREVYFDENAVLSPGFDRLSAGSRVRFCVEAGEDGPQASTVHIVHPHGRHAMTL